jgi:hypothetical protein
MSGTRVLLASLVTAFLGLSSIHGQEAALAPTGPPLDTPAIAESAPAEVPVPIPPNQPLTEEKVPAASTAPEGDAQAPTTMPNGVEGLGKNGGAAGADGAGPAAGGPGKIFMPPPPLLPLNNWLAYKATPMCCCFQGRHGPIHTEIFLRNGLAFVTGNSILGQVLKTGWDIDGGGRALFFNPQETRAWVVTLGVSNINNTARENPTSYTVHNVVVRSGFFNPSTNTTNPVEVVVPQVNVTVGGYTQTFVNLAGGQEYYLLGSANPSQNCLMWRVGWDFGGRWGTSRIDLNEVRHHTDTVGGMFGAVHTDLEYPFHCAILQAGIRLEYNYIWNDALQEQNPSDFQSINLLFSGGVRW